MAKLKGPLFSLTAQGSLAKKLIYKMRNGNAHLAKYNFPHSRNKGEPSVLQLEKRENYYLAMALWYSLPPEEKQNWALFLKDGFVII